MSSITRPATVAAAAAVLLVTALPSTRASGNDEHSRPHNGRIAYSVGAVLPDPDPSAHSQVYTVRPDGSDVRQLTHVVAPVQAGDPSYSPDASRIAYVSNASGSYQVWVMNADGTGQHRLVTDPGHDAFLPRWSATGSRLVFTRCTMPFGFLECTIAEVHSDGTGLHDLTGGHWADFDARFAPDGGSVVFSGARDGYISAIWRTSGHLDGDDAPRRLTAAVLEAFWPSFSPDGRTILFTDSANRPTSQLFTMRRDGHHVRQLSHVPSPAQTGFGSYSPDGRRIVSDLSPDPNGSPQEGLAVMNADGTHQVTIVVTGNLTIADWGVRR